jgi:hypothetical protein
VPVIPSIVAVARESKTSTIQCGMSSIYEMSCPEGDPETLPGSCAALARGLVAS